VLGISDEVASERLCQLARKQLERLLESENESVRLPAAASLFSYRATKPAQEEDAGCHSSHSPMSPAAGCAD
jgi:hypothetical protein